MLTAKATVIYMSSFWDSYFTKRSFPLVKTIIQSQKDINILYLTKKQCEQMFTVYFKTDSLDYHKAVDNERIIKFVKCYAAAINILVFVLYYFSGV